MDAQELRAALRPCDKSRPYAFLSYSSKDAETVWRDAVYLQEHGYNIWIDEANVDKRKPSWKHDALSAISHFNCVLMLFYVSRSSLTSSPCLGEISNTVSEETASLHIADGKVPFVAVDAEPVGHIGRFMNAAYEEIRSGDDAEAVKKSKLENMYSFRVNWFPPDNERVRIKHSSEYSQPADYYSDIEKELKRQNVAVGDLPDVNKSSKRSAEKSELKPSDAPIHADTDAASFVSKKKTGIKALIGLLCACVLLTAAVLCIILLPKCGAKPADDPNAQQGTSAPVAEPTVAPVAEPTVDPGVLLYEYNPDSGYEELTLREGASVSGALVIPPEIDGKPVQRIAEEAFRDCTELTSVTVPDSVLEIGAGAFRGCESLREIEIPFIGRSREAVGYEAVFGYIFGFESEEKDGRPDSSVMTEIGNSNYSLYFFGPERPKRVQQYTFLHWLSIDQNHTLYYYWIPESIVKVTVTDDSDIPDCAFNGCVNIEQIDIKAGSFEDSYLGMAAFRNCTSLKKLFSDTDGELVIGPAFTGIPAYAFENCSLFTKVSIADNTRFIGEGAFKGCTGITDMTVPFVGETEDAENEKAVFGWIFGYITYGEEAYPEDMELEEAEVLSAYGADVTYTTTTFVYSFPDATPQYVETNAGGRWLTYGWSYYIPSSIKRVTVTHQLKLKSFAFCNCKFETITLPEGCSYTDYTFYNCTAERSFG